MENCYFYIGDGPWLYFTFERSPGEITNLCFEYIYHVTNQDRRWNA